MSIHEQVYRPWTGIPASRGRSWWVISRWGVGLQLRRRWFLLLLLAALIPFFVRAVQIHFFGRLEAQGMVRVDPLFFRNFLVQQNLWLFFIALLSGSGLVASDWRHRALGFYFSRPLTALDYGLGKFGIVGFFLALVSFLPGELLFLMRVLYGGGDGFGARYAWVPLSIALFSACQVAAFGAAALAASSLARSGRLAGLLFAALYLLPDLVRQILGLIVLRGREIPRLTLRGQLEALADGLFGTAEASAAATVGAVVFLAALAAAAAFLLRRRVRGAEVVR
jgi:ABC-2 type transport system permease protein